MTDIPPGRYRIVERKGRIIVTDTWANGRPSLPPAPLPGQRWKPDRAVPPALARLRSRLVMLSCLGAIDDAGRPILTTQNFFDEKGPRGITLSEAGATRLGNMLLSVGALGGAALIGLSFTPFAVVLAIGVLGLAFTSANTTARPAITRWLDTLGDDRVR